MTVKTQHDHQMSQKREKHTLDATGVSLGRLASEVAKHLMGKHKITFSYHVDSGDHVMVTNIQAVRVTGTKPTDKIYYHHSEFMGGLKQIDYKTLAIKKPGEALRLAVKGMLPRTKLGTDMLRRLKIQSGEVSSSK